MSFELHELVNIPLAVCHAEHCHYVISSQNIFKSTWRSIISSLS